ncbi:hypothetical protein AsAng_0024320 [Aureispira anguillae]|uniref:Uncharacterized protein n=1 Tax=Aureispira anguillae TaxID=2864201 RepID=A0A915YEV7_9BACT|nr:hypothetical protein AsAng_0024320 [Aureispira anguillae]
MNGQKINRRVVGYLPIILGLCIVKQLDIISGVRKTENTFKFQKNVLKRGNSNCVSKIKN